MEGCAVPGGFEGDGAGVFGGAGVVCDGAAGEAALVDSGAFEDGVAGRIGTAEAA